MHKSAVIVFLMLSIPTACLSQQIPLLNGWSSEALPDAPRPQVAKLSVQFSEKSMHATLAAALPHPEDTKSLEGTRVTLSLLSAVSSKSLSGSTFRAYIDRPVVIQGCVTVPAGTIFEGHVQTHPARRMMRQGSMFMTFDRMILPDGKVQETDLHLVDADSPGIKADSEGKLHPALSKKRLAIQLGGTALTAKFADDLAEFAGGTAVGAGSARLVGAGAAATFFVLQKGREVKLNAGDKLEVEFGRSVAPRLQSQ